MTFITAILLIVCGIIAAAGLIVAKRPDARQYIDRLVPYQGGLGVALLAVGVINFLRWLDLFSLLPHMRAIFSLTIYVALATSIVLGFLLGAPLIAKWIPGDSPAERRALTLQGKLAKYQTVVGVVAIVTGLLLLLFELGILSPI